jgi:hypothetical protein
MKSNYDVFLVCWQQILLARKKDFLLRHPNSLIAHRRRPRSRFPPVVRARRVPANRWPILHRRAFWILQHPHANVLVYVRFYRRIFLDVPGRSPLSLSYRSAAGGGGVPAPTSYLCTSRIERSSSARFKKITKLMPRSRRRRGLPALLSCPHLRLRFIDSRTPEFG